MTGDLEVRKLYEQRSDAVAEARGLVQVDDESAEDSLYPADWLVTVNLPIEAARLFRSHARRRSAAARASSGLQWAAPSRRR